MPQEAAKRKATKIRQLELILDELKKIKVDVSKMDEVLKEKMKSILAN